MVTKGSVLALVAASGFWASSTFASVMLFDVNSSETSITQSGWTATGLFVQSPVTFTAVGGVVLADRDRGAANTDGSSGDTANNDMWRDFIFADERGVQVSDPENAGIDIAISGLLADTLYSVRLWAFDDASDGGRNMTWNGNSLSIPSCPDPTSLNDQVVSFLATSNSSGDLLLQGRIGTPRGVCCNVFVNGFELRAVPEPATLAVLGLGLAGMGYLRRRVLSSQSIG